MNGLLKFNKIYFIIAVSIFLIEAGIAVFVHDKIIRPHIGDFLVVILIYCFVKSFFNAPVIPTGLAVLLFSLAVETSQYFHLVNYLGLQNSKFARTVMGTSFEWTDLATYTAGIVAIFITEIIFAKRKLQK